MILSSQNGSNTATLCFSRKQRQNSLSLPFSLYESYYINLRDRIAARGSVGQQSEHGQCELWVVHVIGYRLPV